MSREIQNLLPSETASRTSRKDGAGQGGGERVRPKGTKLSNLYSDNDVIVGTREKRG